MAVASNLMVVYLIFESTVSVGGVPTQQTILEKQKR